MIITVTILGFVCIFTEGAPPNPDRSDEDLPLETRSNGCEDKYSFCETYTNWGWCTKKSWMKEDCPKSCKICGTMDCENLKSEYFCNLVANYGFCSYSWGGPKCKKSCNLCGVKLCYNSHSGGDASCDYYASLGWCTWTQWMPKKCTKSCGYCNCPEGTDPGPNCFSQG